MGFEEFQKFNANIDPNPHARMDHLDRIFFAGLYVHPNWWVGSDLITVYLIPMASLSWVAIVYAEQKRIPR